MILVVKYKCEILITHIFSLNMIFLDINEKFKYQKNNSDEKGKMMYFI